MEVAFYKSGTGRSPVRDAIEELGKADQARFAEVADGIERYGFGCPRVGFR
jgi:hypothetical protein